jgi:amidase
MKDLDIEGATSGKLERRTFASKDLFDVEHYVTGAGNPDWFSTHEAAKKNAYAVQCLLDAGADLRAKACTDELAFSLDGINVHYGIPLNPQDERRIPGGSSSGSAAMVGAKLVDFALGTDTGGSVRIPAAYCGIFGIRTTHGAIDRSGVIPLAPSADSVGWFARDPDILRLVGEVLLAGSRQHSANLKKVIFATDVFQMVAPDFGKQAWSSAQKLKKLFSKFEEKNIAFTNFQDQLDCYRVTQGREAWQCHGEWIEQAKPKFADDIQQRFNYAAKVTEDDYNTADQYRRRLTAHYEILLKEGTVICQPTSYDLPPLIDGADATLANIRVQNLKLTSTASLTGVCQVSIPMEGMNGLQIGISLIARKEFDLSLLRLAESIANSIA